MPTLEDQRHETVMGQLAFVQGVLVVILPVVVALFFYAATASNALMRIEYKLSDIDDRAERAARILTEHATETNH